MRLSNIQRVSFQSRGLGLRILTTSDHEASLPARSAPPAGGSIESARTPSRPQTGVGTNATQRTFRDDATQRTAAVRDGRHLEHEPSSGARASSPFTRTALRATES